MTQQDDLDSEELRHIHIQQCFQDLIAYCDGMYEFAVASGADRNRAACEAKHIHGCILRLQRLIKL